MRENHKEMNSLREVIAALLIGNCTHGEEHDANGGAVPKEARLENEGSGLLLTNQCKTERSKMPH